MIEEEADKRKGREMDGPVLQLYPLPARETSLERLYLAHNLRQRGDETGENKG